jgi:outer membrane protein TolC
MALAYTMGLAWNADVAPKDTEVPHRPFAGKLDDLVSMAYQFSPDWAKLEAGLRAFEGARHSAQSAYYPRFGFTGQLYKLWNSYDMGMATAQNKGGWTVGLGLEIPVFNGFLTAGKVAEARARLDKLKQEKFLLREGLGVQIRDLFLSLA